MGKEVQKKTEDSFPAALHIKILTSMPIKSFEVLAGFAEICVNDDEVWSVYTTSSNVTFLILAECVPAGTFPASLLGSMEVFASSLLTVHDVNSSQDLKAACASLSDVSHFPALLSVGNLAACLVPRPLNDA